MLRENSSEFREIFIFCGENTLSCRKRVLSYLLFSEGKLPRRILLEYRAPFPPQRKTVLTPTAKPILDKRENHCTKKIYGAFFQNVFDFMKEFPVEYAINEIFPQWDPDSTQATYSHKITTIVVLLQYTVDVSNGMIQDGVSWRNRSLEDRDNNGVVEICSDGAENS